MTILHAFCKLLHWHCQGYQTAIEKLSNVYAQRIGKVPRGGCVFTEKCSVFFKTKVVVLKVLKPDDFYVKYYFDWTNGWIEARIHLKLGNSCVLEATIQVLTSACNHEKTRPMLAKVQNRLKKISILVSFL